MNEFSVVLTYEPLGRRPVPVARVKDPTIIVETARAALSEAERRSDALRSRDSTLSALEDAEILRLRRVLEMLAPVDEHAGPVM